jgi:hypothetical protein
MIKACVPFVHVAIVFAEVVGSVSQRLTNVFVEFAAGDSKRSRTTNVSSPRTKTNSRRHVLRAVTGGTRFVEM